MGLFRLVLFLLISLPANKAAYAQPYYPITFTLSPDDVKTVNIQDGAVITSKIPNGAVTRLKINKEPSDNPMNNSPLLWSTSGNNFIFGAPIGGGIGDGVVAIEYEAGIVGAGTSASGTVPITVDAGSFGVPGLSKIPFFNMNNNKILLDRDASTGDDITGIRFLDSTGHFDIFNDGLLTIESNTGAELLTLDYNGDLSVGGSEVCTQSSGCNPIPGSAVTAVSAIAPLAASGTTSIVIRALTPNQPNNLVRLDMATRLPAVSGANLTNVVHSITPGQAISVSDIMPNIPLLSVVFGGSSTYAQNWYKNLDDIGPLPHNANAVIIGKDDGSGFTEESGSTFLSSIFGTPPSPASPSYIRWDGSAWTNQTLPYCDPKSVVLSPAGNLTCAGFSSTIQLGTLISSNSIGVQINRNAGSGQLLFMDASGGANSVGFRAPGAVTTSVVWTLPPADATSTGAPLTTNAAGALSWGSNAAGNVVGPASSSDMAIVRYNGTTGRLIQNSGVIIDNSDNVTGIVNLRTDGSLTINNNGSNSSTFPTTRGNGGEILASNGAGTLSWQIPVVSDLSRVTNEEEISFNPVVLHNVNGWPGGAGTNPLVVPAGYNGMYFSDGNYTSPVYLPDINPTVGAAMYYMADSAFDPVVKNARTNMAGDISVVTGNTAIFVSDGTTWNFQGTMPQAQFYATRKWPVYDSTGSFKASGQIASGGSSIATGAIDWNSGNLISTTFNCATPITFANLKDGGTYTLFNTNAATTQCNFSTTTTGADGAVVAFRFRPANSARVASSHTSYTLIRAGNVVYVSWGSNFQ